MYPTDVDLTHFNNGLQLLFQPNYSVSVITVQAWINAGSADETTQEAGIAHILEHMLFKGTGNYPREEIARIIESTGGQINAFASFDQTVYHLTIDSSRLELATNIISNMVQNPLIEETSLSLLCDEYYRRRGTIYRRHRDDGVSKPTEF